MKKVFAFLFGGGTTGGQPKNKDKTLGLSAIRGATAPHRQIKSRH